MATEMFDEQDRSEPCQVCALDTHGICYRCGQTILPETTETEETVSLKLPKFVVSAFQKTARQMREHIQRGPSANPSILYPTAHIYDDNLQKEYEELVGTSLLSARERSIRNIEATEPRMEISREALEKWVADLSVVRIANKEALDAGEEGSQMFELLSSATITFILSKHFGVNVH